MELEEARQGSTGKTGGVGRPVLLWGVTLPTQQQGTTEEQSSLRWFDRLSEVEGGRSQPCIPSTYLVNTVHRRLSSEDYDEDREEAAQDIQKS